MVSSLSWRGDAEVSEADPTEHDSVAATLLVRRNDGISVDSTEGRGAVLYASQRAGEWTGSKVTEIVEDTPSERHHRNVISAPEQALESARMERQERVQTWLTQCHEVAEVAVVAANGRVGGPAAYEYGR
jgi:hypothetical protein